MIGAHMNLVAGHRCFIIHRLNPKVYDVNIKNGKSKVIKAMLRFSQHLVYALMFKVGFYFRSLIITKLIAKEAPICLGHCYPAIRFISHLPSWTSNTLSDYIQLEHV